jgi:ABC-type glycerol-3-phosphate transport system permease component
MKATRVFRGIGFYILVFVVCLIVICPFILLISYSIRNSNDIFNLDISLIPQRPTLDAYRNAVSYRIGSSGFLTWGINSLLICGLSTAGAICASAASGYALTRYRFYGRRAYWYIIVLTQSVPWVVLLIPYYIELSRFGLVNTKASLALTYFAVFLPVCTWLFTGFFKSIPVEMEEAARMDGCSPWRIFFQIVMPLSISGVCAIALFAFVIGWGDFLFASIIMKTDRNWTLPIGIVSFRGEHKIRWAEIMAVSTVITIPIVVLFLYLQKHLISLMSGGVKE